MYFAMMCLLVSAAIRAGDLRALPPQGGYALFGPLRSTARFASSSFTP
ncbi:hypothetical protein ACFPRL_27170 [Pseudoclavibacter helvolus]